MKILVACEESQAVTKELRNLGHEAYSCDIIDCSGGHPEWHIKKDVLSILNPGRNTNYSGVTCSVNAENGDIIHLPSKWDMIIAFPPCTHLCVSGARHFEKKRNDGRQEAAINFFMEFINADCDKIAVENPIGIISGDYIGEHFPHLKEKYSFPLKTTQIIQPWQFGNKFTKSTCLWLKGLNELIPTEIVEKGEFKEWVDSNGKKKRQPMWFFEALKNAKTPQERACIRSKTFHGIAKAMADQWTK